MIASNTHVDDAALLEYMISDTPEIGVPPAWHDLPREDCDPAPTAAGLRLYANEVRRLELPSDAEARGLIRQARSGSQPAMCQVLVRHLSLVVELVEQRCADGDDVLGALECGNLALVRAVNSFDHTGDDRFETFARRRIHQALATARV